MVSEFGNTGHNLPRIAHTTELYECFHIQHVRRGSSMGYRVGKPRMHRHSLPLSHSFLDTRHQALRWKGTRKHLKEGPKYRGRLAGLVL